MNLVEVTVGENVFVIPYEDSTTVAQLADTALGEYQKAFFERVPGKVKYVQDSRRRILAGSLLVSDQSVDKSLVVELTEGYIEGRAPLNNDICEQYCMWQTYTSARAKKVIDTMVDSPSKAEPGDEFLSMLQDLKYSRFEPVQADVVDSLGMILMYFRTKKFGSFAILELQHIVRHSVFANVALNALRKISTSRTAHKFIDTRRLLEDMPKVLEKFGDDVQSEFFDLYDYLDSSAASSSAAVEPSPNSALSVAAIAPRPPSSLLSAAIPSAAVAPAPLAMAEEPHQDASDSGSGLRSRILALLVSADVKNRQYAVGKVVQLLWDREGTERSLWGRDDWEALCGALLKCVKMSLKPPQAKFIQPAPGSTAEKSAGGPSVLVMQKMIETIRAAHVASLALSSADSDVVSVLFCLRSLCIIGSRDPAVVVAALLNGDAAHCRLLGTLMHATGDLTAGVSSSAAALLKATSTGIEDDRVPYGRSTSSISRLSIGDASALCLLIAMNSAADRLAGGGYDLRGNARWSSRLKLENRTLVMFIQEEDYSPRAEVAMVYLLNLVHCCLPGDQQSAEANSARRGDDKDGPVDVDVIQMLTDQDFAVLKNLWKWALAGIRRMCLLSLQVLSAVSTNSSVQMFLNERKASSKVFGPLHGSKCYLDECY
jgi:hypothetical protein